MSERKFTLSTFLSLLGAGVLAISLAACGGSEPAAPPAAGDAVSVTEASLPGVTAADLTQVMTYRMPGVGGSLVEATAVVMIPTGVVPSQGWPVIGWGHGPTGVADACAPSASPTLAEYDIYLNAFVAAGFAVVAPDYEGLGSAGVHPYLNLDSAGRSLIHAVGAATRQYPQLSTQYALLGHSQGGHAVIGAAELAAAGEADGLTLLGVVAIAPVSQVGLQGEFLQSLSDDPTQLIATREDAAVTRIADLSLILAGVEAIDPTYDATLAYGPDGDFIETLVTQECLEFIRDDLSAPVLEVIGLDNDTEALLPRNAVDHPAVTAYLDNIEPGFRPTNVPIVMVQGEFDTTVFPSSTQELLITMRNQGSPDVVVEQYDDEDHLSILVASRDSVLNEFDNWFANAVSQ